PREQSHFGLGGAAVFETNPTCYQTERAERQIRGGSPVRAASGPRADHAPTVGGTGDGMIERKPDAGRIETCLDELKSGTWLGPARQWWPHFVFFFGDLPHAVRILAAGKLV